MAAMALGQLAPLDRADATAGRRRTARLVARCLDHHRPEKVKITLQEREVAARIGAAASSIAGVFCCGGRLVIPQQETIPLWFNGSSARASMLKLPSATVSDEVMQQLVDTQGSQVDEQGMVRRVSLPPSLFATSFDLGKTTILDDVYAILASCTDVRVEDDHPPRLCTKSLDMIIHGVRAELYKLDVYEQGPGFYRDEQVVAPDDDGESSVFGWLVVCLPHTSTGGVRQLVVSRGGESQVVDWSSSSQVQWAAFFADCSHKVVQLQPGRMITLTFKLHRSKRAGTGVEFPAMPSHFVTDDDGPSSDWVARRRDEFQLKYQASSRAVHYFPGSSNSTLDAATLPLCKVLCEARDDPDFFPRGCTLAFGCKHHYFEVDYMPIWEDDPRALLTGADAVLYAAAASCGLAPSLVRLFKNGDGNCWHGGRPPPTFLQRPNVVLAKSLWIPPPDFLGCALALHKNFEDKCYGGWYAMEKLVWCTREQDWCCRSSEQELRRPGTLPWYSSTAILLRMKQ